MQQYRGAKQILERLGYSQRTNLPQLIVKFGLPVHLRRLPGKLRSAYYASEPMILAWELSTANILREKIIAEVKSGFDRRYRALERKRKIATSCDPVTS